MPDAGRVITGAARGLRLAAPGEGTRPLSDRVKQALFATLESMLGPAWPTTFLDVFAGSGAAGIEALSRGAPVALFVESDARAAAVIEQNLRRTNVAGGHVARRDALRLLAAGRGTGAPFGAALVDPPYARADLLAGALERIGDPRLGWLCDDAVVVAKHFWRDAPPDSIGDLARERVRRFGETALTFYRRVPQPDALSGTERPPDAHPATERPA